MPSYQIRSLRADDFEVLSLLEREIFGLAGEALLCPHYLRLCCEVFADSCFIAFDGDHAVGYLLGFVKARRAHCATLAVRPEYQRRRATSMLIGAFVRSILDHVDECWFTVKEDNLAARSLHAFLGAREMGRRTDYYGRGDERIVACIDRDGFDRMKARYQRLGFAGSGSPGDAGHASSAASAAEAA
jgi:ribosomal protein S18 acetylase RimI-like enzyme